MLCWKITRAADSGYRGTFIGLAYWLHISALTGELDVGIFCLLIMRRSVTKDSAN